jgi:hypothetical protein
MFRILTKLAMTVVLAAIGIAALSGTANASRSLQVNGGAFLAISQGLLSLRTTLGGIPRDITCLVTLHGSLSTIIPKRSGTLFGKITGRTIQNPCNPTIGNVTTAEVEGLPWKLIYLTFTGTLPNPNLVVFQVQGAAFRIRITSVTPVSGCGFRGDVPAAIAFRGSAPNTSGLIAIIRHTVPGLREAGCPANGQLIGRFSVTPTQTLVLL